MPSQFKRVEVTESSGANGKSVMEFISRDDYGIWEPTNLSLSMQQRFAYWAYGLLKKSSVFDVNGNLVKQTENHYNFLKAKRSFGYHPGQDNRYPSCKCLVKKSSSERNPNWEIEPKLYKTSSNDNDDLVVKFYQTYSGRVELDTSYERVFKASGSSDYLETITKYEYNNDNYQVNKILTTQSNGDKNEKTIKYNVDIPFEILGELKQHNILSIPVATTMAVKKNGATDFKYLSETVTEFVAVGNGDIKPFRTLERRFNQPQLLESYYLYQGPNNPSNLVNYKETQTFTYNAAGNLTGMKDEGNRTISNIYDYDDKYVVASVINADPNLDMPAYTSFETQTLGGWVLNGSSNIINTSSVTGVRSFGLTSSGSLTANLNTAKPYKLSFWANNNSVTVSSNASLIKSEPVINGFTYYEYSIPQGASGITINGNASIDELRLYPQTARMRTVAYDPLIGKTSECDENNRIMYYEYDDLARLRFIKDERKNVIKMYEYNYAKKPSGCTVTYSNNAITEIYTKNTCAAGYTGSNVSFIIPANKYTSTISQADADRQAENELDADAQNYANANGSCFQIFYNVAKSQTFTKEGCDIGYAGTSVTYNVPAGRYKSTVSQVAADYFAQIY